MSDCGKFLACANDDPGAKAPGAGHIDLKIERCFAARPSLPPADLAPDDTFIISDASFLWFWYKMTEVTSGDNWNVCQVDDNL
jgi:hypothetical protein